jgi:hypothetical protein
MSATPSVTTPVTTPAITSYTISPSQVSTINRENNEAYTSLQNYSTAYTNYVMCLEKNLLVRDGTDPNPQDGATCSPPDDTDLMTQIQQLQTQINQAATSSSDASYNNIIQTYNNVVKLRSELDMKLNDLYSVQNSVPNMYQQQLDTTIYGTILWTVLATCFIYYLYDLR